MQGKVTKTAVERLQPNGEWLWDTTVKGFGRADSGTGYFTISGIALADTNAFAQLAAMDRPGRLTPPELTHWRN